MPVFWGTGFFFGGGKRGKAKNPAGRPFLKNERAPWKRRKKSPGLTRRPKGFFGTPRWTPELNRRTGPSNQQPWYPLAAAGPSCRLRPSAQGGARSAKGPSFAEASGIAASTHNRDSHLAAACAGAPPWPGSPAESAQFRADLLAKGCSCGRGSSGTGLWRWVLGAAATAGPGPGGGLLWRVQVRFSAPQPEGVVPCRGTSIGLDQASSADWPAARKAACALGVSWLVAKSQSAHSGWGCG